MIDFEVTGTKELAEYLNSLSVKLSSNEVWGPELAAMMEEARRYAASISPVLTGSYRAAHRVVVGNMEATLGIDPSAVNRVSGTLVSRYAGPVEKRHQVYAQTGVFVGRLATQRAEIIGEAFIHGN